MKPYNTNPAETFHKTPLASDDSAAQARVLRAALTVQNELTLDDDCDLGSDPYNATGQHMLVCEP